MTDQPNVPDPRLETLRQEMLGLFGGAVPQDLAIYAAALPRSLDRAAATGNAAIRKRILDQVELAIAAFKAAAPDKGLIDELISNVRGVDSEAQRGFQGVVLRFVGGSPLWAALLGAALSVVATTYLLFGLAVLLSSYSRAEVPIDPLVFAFMAFGAMGGAITSVLTRLDDFAAMGRAKIELVFLNALVKPIVAVFLAITVVALFSSDAVNIAGFDIKVADIDPKNSEYLKQLAIFWSVGFLSGFSERFARDVVGRVDPAGEAPQPKPEK
jgi:hypothetical protein